MDMCGLRANETLSKTTNAAVLVVYFLNRPQFHHLALLRPPPPHILPQLPLGLRIGMGMMGLGIGMGIGMGIGLGIGIGIGGIGGRGDGRKDPQN